MKVLFNAPIKIGKVLYPKSKNPVELDDALADNWFVKAKMEEGVISLFAEPKAKAKAAEAPAPAASKKA